MTCGGTGARIVISSEPLAVREGLRQLFDTLLLRSLPETERGEAEIVLAEALNNIVEHAYACEEGEIELTLQLGRDALACRIIDSGTPMPGEQLPEARSPELAGSLPEGGFGWTMIRSLARDLTYNRVDGRNELSFRLETRAPSDVSDKKPGPRGI